MLNIHSRIDLLEKLGKYIISDEEKKCSESQNKAIQANAWFTEEHIQIALNNIVNEFLQKDKLEKWISNYKLPDTPKNVGIVMAGNIPLVGFHDLLCGFLSGHHLTIKLSSKDNILLPHLVEKLTEWDPEVGRQIEFSEMLKGCDAYIATGSNNTARYFGQYFGKFPHIIRKNRTSIAILDGNESDEDLSKLADDVFVYYGLGCRNVTQLCLPEGYNFEKLMRAFEKYASFIDHNKYKNNYDYYLAIYLLNKVPYITNGSILLVENQLPFSAVSVLHYRFYNDKKQLEGEIIEHNDIQCIIGNGHTPFGKAQTPSLHDFADGVDTMRFLCNL